jgi:hypothetical protein
VVARPDEPTTNLRQYRAIAIDVGNQDGLRIDAGKLHDVLEKYALQTASKSIRACTQIGWPIVSRIM